MTDDMDQIYFRLASDSLNLGLVYLRDAYASAQLKDNQLLMAQLRGLIGSAGHRIRALEIMGGITDD